jgi:hypothetical protein
MVPNGKSTNKVLLGGHRQVFWLALPCLMRRLNHSQYLLLGLDKGYRLTPFKQLDNGHKKATFVFIHPTFEIKTTCQINMKVIFMVLALVLGSQFVSAQTAVIGGKKIAIGLEIYSHRAMVAKAGIFDFQLDVFWAFHAGIDPAALLEKHPKRFISLHLKDMKKGEKTGFFTGGADVETNVALGAGQLDFAKIMASAVKTGVKGFYIEDESSLAAGQIPLTLNFLAKLK